METLAIVLGRMSLALIALLLFIDASISQETCTQPEGSLCICTFADGTKIDLTPLDTSKGSSNPSFDFKKNKAGDYEFAYNPCTGFTTPNVGCQNVAACQRSVSGDNYFNIGAVDSAKFTDTGDQVKYSATIAGQPERKTDVQLICDDKANSPKYEVLGEQSSNEVEYELRITSCHICRDGCSGGGSKDSLSFGSILCILFVVLVFVYLVGGILFNRYARGASGKEVIPNVSMWEEFPLLVKDGFVFVAGCCKSDASYESI